MLFQIMLGVGKVAAQRGPQLFEPDFALKISRQDIRLLKLYNMLSVTRPAIRKSGLL